VTTLGSGAAKIDHEELEHRASQSYRAARALYRSTFADAHVLFRWGSTCMQCFGQSPAWHRAERPKRGRHHAALRAARQATGVAHRSVASQSGFARLACDTTRREEASILHPGAQPPKSRTSTRVAMSGNPPYVCPSARANTSTMKRQSQGSASSRTLQWRDGARPATLSPPLYEYVRKIPRAQLGSLRSCRAIEARAALAARSDADAR